MLVLTLGTSTVLSSCGGDDDNNAGPVDRTPAGVEAVDLGLPSGTKWASANIGATKPEQYGDYFAWGETTGYNEGKTDFSWKNYKWASKGYNGSINKYTVPDNLTDGEWYSGDTFVGDNKTTLDLTGDQIDDVARAKWGGKWRMPTFEEIVELRKECNWTKATVNGIDGYRVSSKAPGNQNSIFLPFTGKRIGTSLEDNGVSGSYWSSSLRRDCSLDAYAMYLGQYNTNESNYDRYRGCAVRPVCK